MILGTQTDIALRKSGLVRSPVPGNGRLDSKRVIYGSLRFR